MKHIVVALTEEQHRVLLGEAPFVAHLLHNLATHRSLYKGDDALNRADKIDKALDAVSKQLLLTEAWVDAKDIQMDTSVEHDSEAGDEGRLYFDKTLSNKEMRKLRVIDEEFDAKEDEVKSRLQSIKDEYTALLEDFGGPNRHQKLARLDRAIRRTEAEYAKLTNERENRVYAVLNPA